MTQKSLLTRITRKGLSGTTWHESSDKQQNTCLYPASSVCTAASIFLHLHVPKRSVHIYEGRPINKLQNGIILLIFKI